MKELLKRIFTKTQPEVEQAGRQRLVFDSPPETVYAIGDVHGCLAALKRLESKIVADAANRDGRKLLVYLGDYIDRGPSSAQVIDHLLARPPAGFERVCLAGNHEEMFLDFIQSDYRQKDWLAFGGEETLASYGVYVGAQPASQLPLRVRSCVPDEHLQFLRSLPIMLKAGKNCFVHAGIDPALPLDKQQDSVLQWSRPKDFAWSGQNIGMTIIHGHTPVQTVDITPSRINVDIGAYRGGVLAAVRLAGDEVTVIYSD
ncbi:metallophosphoesterase family protein [Rhizobium sp. RU36D]|uniref:metallophosphoesterase family protein n=1 Tax=Rhizobium sp. RU36D TaxID=1907415 RepID=UPI0009D88E0D|nr:metallophosphoesterase family protein [Rhizobium sp. RU36D]SMD15631.1 serine/threonine protein phosphatase 1 [Rhizobium sp. RU36D]